MSDLINYLYSLTNFQKGAYKLDNMKTMIEALELSSLPYRCVHVAGTNGKGSVCHKVANVLSASGYKTGVFSSPHIATFRERVVIDGQMIEEKKAFILIHEILDCYSKKELTPTFFEVMTLLALSYFKEQKVQFAVLETGLGGRLDATNVVNSDLSIITSISLDHTHILGDTLEKIALEKAGIIKEKTPLVLGPTALLEPILQKAKELEVLVEKIEKDFSFYDEENEAIARKALNLLKDKYDLQLKNTDTVIKSRPMCRFEILDNIIFDVAHNIAGIKKLISSLKKRYPQKKLRFLLGISKDKEIKELLKEISNAASGIHLVSTGERLASIDTLASFIKDSNLYSFENSFVETVKKAFSLSKQNNEILVVTGSFFIMQEVKKALGIEVNVDKLSLNERMVLG